MKIEYGYPERTSDARIRIRIRPQPDAQGKGYRLQIDSDMGWTSGQLPLDGTTSVNDVPVARRGDNEFRVMLFDRSGNAIQDAETKIVVKRTDATSGGTPITHTIAVKVVTDEGGIPKNTLHELVAKGQIDSSQRDRELSGRKRSSGAATGTVSTSRSIRWMPA